MFSDLSLGLSRTFGADNTAADARVDSGSKKDDIANFLRWILNLFQFKNY